MQLKDALVSYRKVRGLSQGGLADELGVTQQTLSKWEAGKLEPSAACRDILTRVVAPIRLASRARWIDRVNQARGRAILVDKALTVLAATADTRARFAPRFGSIIGRSANDITADRQPGSESSLGDSGPPFPRLNKIGFFSGSVRSAHWKAEFHYPDTCFCLVQDCWPIVTTEGEILAHILAYILPDIERAEGFVGVKVHWFDVILNKDAPAGADHV